MKVSKKSVTEQEHFQHGKSEEAAAKAKQFLWWVFKWGGVIKQDKE
ncbi:hypothetical protein [Alloalcanivorax profundimaris]|nr:hypothetical protein [Alloalcanivorax profundimaris]